MMQPQKNSKKYKITLNEIVYEVLVEEVPVTEKDVPISLGMDALPDLILRSVKAPVAGGIIKIAVKAGDTVKKGDTLCIMDAMKMETNIPSPQDGIIREVLATKGKKVNSGDILFTMSLT